MSIITTSLLAWWPCIWVSNAERTNMKDWQILLILAVLYCVAIVAWRRTRRFDGETGGSKPEAVEQSLKAAVMARTYNPSKVGNDSAARPWESLPVGFAEAPADAADAEMDETAAFIAQARNCFVAMQQAWDEADIARLRAMMTQEMADTVNDRLQERAEQGPSPQAAEIVVLEARFLDMEQTQNQRIASVEFSGMVREAQTLAPAPFREIWDMTQSRDDPGACWLVAGVESLQ